MNKKQFLFACAFLPLLLASCGNSGVEESSEGRVYSDSILPSPIAYKGNAEQKPIYQILVYSFADSDGDGVGDFQGIIDHLDYLAELNVGTLWLSPIHPSTSYHHYDVKDYFSADSLYGGMDKFEELVNEAKEKGIGIMLDMVFNHASLSSQWFNDSAEAFAKAVEEGKLEAVRKDPNNIANDFVFSTKNTDISGTTYHVNKRGINVFYEGNFSQQMPEFNLGSSGTRAKQEAIMDFWISKGVSGFRFDGVKYFFLGQLNESKAYLSHLADYARSKKPDINLVGEYWDGGTQLTYNMFIDKMAIFNFPTSIGGGNGKGAPTYSIRSGDSHVFSKVLYNVQKAVLDNSGGIVNPTYFLNNHDMNRYSSGNINEMKVSAASYLLTPGTPTIYYGEEIALKGKRLASQNTDAARRLPMRWYGEESLDEYRCKPFEGAFDPEDQITIGALEAKEDANSLLNYYKKVLAFRNEHIELQKGSYICFGDDEEELSMSRIEYRGETVGYLFHNFDMEPHTTYMAPKGCQMDASLSLGQDTYSENQLTLSPYSTVYLKEVQA